MRLLGDRVLVALPPADEAETVTDSGIVLLRNPFKHKIPTQGIVTQLGEKSGTVDLDEVMAVIHECDSCNPIDIKAAVKRLAPAPYDVQVGDCVVFLPGRGETVKEDGIDYVILSEAEIIGVCEPKSEAA